MKNIDNETKSVSLRVVLDGIAFCIIGIPLLLCETHVLKPFKRGFFCDDPSIHYPFHPSTFNSLVALILGSGIPVAVILTVEYIHYHRSKQCNGPPPESSFKITVFGREVSPFLVSLYKYIGGLIFACEIGGMTIDVIKFSLGGLRPHFLAVCIPDWSKINCTDSFGNVRYITDYTCTNEDAEELLEARLTFPSGHANIAFAGLIYLCLYLQVRVQWRTYQMMKHAFQAVLVFLAVYISATRVSDFQHHMADIVAGAFIGAGSAVFVFCVLRLNPFCTLLNRSLIRREIASSLPRHSPRTPLLGNHDSD